MSITIPVDGNANATTTWQATMGLRWNGAVLEQAWQCLNDGRTEWRPVPHRSPFERLGGDADRS